MKYQEIQFTRVKSLNQEYQTNNRLYFTNYDLSYICDGLLLNDNSSNVRYATAWDASDCDFISMRQMHFKPVDNLEKADLDHLEKDKLAFADIFIQSYVRTYLNKPYLHVTTDDKIYLARKKIKREQPIFLKRFDELYPDKRDVAIGIEHIIRIVTNNDINNELLKSLPSGPEKNYEITKKTYNYLTKYGYTNKPGFKEAWSLLTTLYKLPGSIIKNVK